VIHSKVLAMVLLFGSGSVSENGGGGQNLSNIEAFLWQ
jgi:hypothetical protein